MKDLLAEAKERFTVVLLDTPPVLAVIDPVIVSSLADSTVFVVRAGKTTRRSLPGRRGDPGPRPTSSASSSTRSVSAGRGSTPFYHYYQYEYESSSRARQAVRGQAARLPRPGPKS
jgi:hypothetical protein